MTLEEKVMTGMKLAMRTKNLSDLRGLRAIKAAILIAKTEKDATGTLDEAKEIALLQKMIKQRQESLKIFEAQGREELAQKEREEIVVIEQFLPAQLSEKEIIEIIKDIVSKTGANAIKDMGKVMGMAKSTFAGRADNAKVSQLIKQILS